MIDKKEFKIFRNSQINLGSFSQFKEFNCEEEMTPIVQRLYFLMLNGDMPRGESESLYGWCGRLGLSNSTIFGIFKKHNKSMHHSVAQKISASTGANVKWIQYGNGNPFNNESDIQFSNPLKERIKLLMTAEELEKPYSFATRVGLSKGTFTGIWVEGRTSLQKKTIDKIAEATGANPVWLMTGEGEPFKEGQSSQKIDQPQTEYLIEEVRVKEKHKDNSNSSTKLDFITALDPQNLETNQDLRKLLTACYESTEGALYATYRMMDPDDKSEFILKFYKALSAEENISLDIDENTLLLAIFTIEVALYYSRRVMSPESKTELITDIYKQYDSKPEMKQQTLNEYKEYKRRK